MLKIMPSPSTQDFWKPPNPSLWRKKKLGAGSSGDLITKGALIRLNVGPPGGSRQPITALIDSGASITAIDSSAAASLGLPQTGSVKVGGVGGFSQQPVFGAAVEVPGVGRTYDPIQLAGSSLGSPDFQMLLGRNILKELVFTFNGPNGDYTLSLGSGIKPGVATEGGAGASPLPAGATPIPNAPIPTVSGGISLETLGLITGALVSVGGILYFSGVFD